MVGWSCQPSWAMTLSPGLKPSDIGGDDFADAGAAHDLADFGRRDIAADILHPALLRRIEAEIRAS